jgi:hypothetical protein
MYQRNKIVYSDETLQTRERPWNEALEAVAGDEVLERNVKMSALTVAYMRFERRPLPKRFFVTRNPESFAFKDETSKALVKQIRSALKGRKDIRFAESRSDADEQLGYIERVEKPSVPEKGCDRLCLEESAFTRLAWSNRAKFEKDPAAGDGCAMRCFNREFSPAAQLKLKDVAFDSGVSYRVRFRARLANGTACGDVPAFSAFVRGNDGDPFQSKVKRKWELVLRVSEMSEDYAWYETPTWIPSESDTLQVMRGSCDKWSENSKGVPNSVWVDCFEIVREL